MEYTLGYHALKRSIKRSIPSYWIELAIDFGIKRKNYYGTQIIAEINKDICTDLIIQLVEASNELDFEKDREEISLINKKIVSIQKLKDNGKLQVVYNPDTKKIITLFIS